MYDARGQVGYRPHRDASLGSPAWREGRWVSAVLYLNVEWPKEGGGELSLWLPPRHAAPPRPGYTTPHALADESDEEDEVAHEEACLGLRHIVGADECSLELGTWRWHSPPSAAQLQCVLLPLSRLSRLSLGRCTPRPLCRCTVSPTAGTLVLFSSRLVPHAVNPVHGRRRRHALTLWMTQVRRHR
ncbi:MAG: 2OG-Fe(II) oxygenase [Gammaproteobacteria bacterium]|nr:2OG-Fe(II) oxygenase [Gammaproteobacteria bacterium]